MPYVLYQCQWLNNTTWRSNVCIRHVQTAACTCISWIIEVRLVMYTSRNFITAVCSIITSKRNAINRVRTVVIHWTLCFPHTVYARINFLCLYCKVVEVVPTRPALRAIHKDDGPKNEGPKYERSKKEGPLRSALKNDERCKEDIADYCSKEGKTGGNYDTLVCLQGLVKVWYYCSNRCVLGFFFICSKLHKVVSWTFRLFGVSLLMSKIIVWHSKIPKSENQDYQLKGLTRHPH